MSKKVVIGLALSLVAACGGEADEKKARAACQEFHADFCDQYADCVIEGGAAEDRRASLLDACLDAIDERASCDEVVDTSDSLDDCRDDFAAMSCEEFLDPERGFPDSCQGVFLSE